MQPRTSSCRSGSAASGGGGEPASHADSMLSRVSTRRRDCLRIDAIAYTPDGRPTAFGNSTSSLRSRRLERNELSASRRCGSNGWCFTHPKRSVTVRPSRSMTALAFSARSSALAACSSNAAPGASAMLNSPCTFRHHVAAVSPRHDGGFRVGLAGVFRAMWNLEFSKGGSGFVKSWGRASVSGQGDRAETLPPPCHRVRLPASRRSRPAERA